MSNESGVVTITEEDLVKSLAALEGKKETQTEPPKELLKIPSGEVGSTAASIAAGASERLVKALEVSPLLDEITSLLGAHNDRALEALSKSVTAGAERDLSMIRVLEGLRKSIDDNTATLKSLLDKPGAPAAAGEVTVTSSQVLNKSTMTQGTKAALSPVELRKSIMTGLEKLSKNADSSVAAHYGRSLIKFESTREISDADMKAALAESK